MDISIHDIRMECLKLAVYSGDESPDVCLALCERYVDYVQHGVKRPAPIISMAEMIVRQNGNQAVGDKFVRIVANGPGDGA